MFGWIASKFHDTKIMSYDTPSLLATLSRDDFSGGHLKLLPDGHSGRHQVADDMKKGLAAIRELKMNFMPAPQGTVWYVARTFQHRAGWSVHGAVAVRTDDVEGGIALYDLDGAEGEDWKEGPSSFRSDLRFEEFFTGCGKASADNKVMSFAQDKHFCIFVPITISSHREVSLIAHSLKEHPHFARYHYLNCNCHSYAVRIIMQLCNGMPEFLALVLCKVIPKAHSSVAGAEPVPRRLACLSWCLYSRFFSVGQRRFVLQQCRWPLLLLEYEWSKV
mmetsp:Transcript_35280/g.88888  ORF Transcript_35280/g.88888 Transcript_35280/m.88888 type:complete len:276 (-) Transcript_35280:302-1129(-)